MAKILDTSSTPDSYNPVLEAKRVMYADVVVRGRRVNRGTASVRITGRIETEETAAVRKAWHSHIFPTTLPGDAPVIHMDWPTHGPFVLAPHGTYFDTYLGVAQKLLDEHHPNFKHMLENLEDAGLMLRREIVTDDYVAVDPDTGVHTPHDLAGLWSEAVGRRWPKPGCRPDVSSASTMKSSWPRSGSCTREITTIGWCPMARRALRDRD